MKIRNSESLPKERLYYCYDEKIHDFLYNQRKIGYINKGINEEGKEYYIYFKSELLLSTLSEIG